MPNYTKVQGPAQGVNGPATFGSGIGANRLVVLSILISSANTVSAVTNDKGDMGVRGPNASNATGTLQSAEVWFFENPTAGATVFTPTVSGGTYVVEMYEYSTPGAFGTATLMTDNHGNSNSPSGNALNPSADFLVFAYCILLNGGETLVMGSGYTLGKQTTYVVNGFDFYGEFTGSTTPNASWSGGSDAWYMLGVAFNITVDTTPPTNTSNITSIDGNHVYVTMNEPCGPASGATGFVVNDNGSPASQSGVTWDGTNSRFDIAMSSAMTAGHTYTLDYTDPSDTHSVTDTAGNHLANFTGHAVTNGIAHPFGAISQFGDLGDGLAAGTGIKVQFNVDVRPLIYRNFFGGLHLDLSGGPVLIVGSTPAQTGSGNSLRNGIVLNPDLHRDGVGTETMNLFDGRRNLTTGSPLAYPIQIQQGDSVQLSKSNNPSGSPDVWDQTNAANYSSGVVWPQIFSDGYTGVLLRLVWTISCTNGKPPSDCLRPPPFKVVGAKPGRDSTPLILVSDLRWPAFLDKAVPSGQTLPSFTAISNAIGQGDWNDYAIEDRKGDVMGYEQQQCTNQREYAGYFGGAAKLAMECTGWTLAQKKYVMAFFYQLGIDGYYALLNEASIYGPNGGHNGGRYFNLYVAQKGLNVTWDLSGFTFQELYNNRFASVAYSRTAQTFWNVSGNQYATDLVWGASDPLFETYLPSTWQSPPLNGTLPWDKGIGYQLQNSPSLLGEIAFLRLAGWLTGYPAEIIAAADRQAYDTSFSSTKARMNAAAVGIGSTGWDTTDPISVPTTLTSGGTIGSTSLVVADGSSFSTSYGAYIEYDGTHSGEAITITNIVGNILTISPALAIAHSGGASVYGLSWTDPLYTAQSTWTPGPGGANEAYGTAYNGFVTNMFKDWRTYVAPASSTRSAGIGLIGII